MGNDLLFAPFIGVASSFYAGPPPSYTDEWSITWKWTDIYTEPQVHPLANDEKVESYKTPDPTLDERYVKVRELKALYGSNFAIVGGVDCSIFEAAWYLRGFEKVLSDFRLNKDLINILLDKTSDFSRRAGVRYVQEGVDIIRTGDDFGSQDGMLISPTTWREFFKDRYAGMFASFKRANPGVKIAYHSCGNTMPIIPDLIEIGLDILNPVQPLALNPAELKRKFGKHLCFWGGIDIQRTLPFGDKKLIEEEVKTRLTQLKQDGGLILGPAHNVQDDTSVENLLCFYEAARKWGAL